MGTTRESVYCEWAKEQIRRDRAATVLQSQLAGFRLVQQIRRGKGGERTDRPKKTLVRPWAIIRGELCVDDPEAFSEMLMHGVGRHCSFGYGMLLLKPAP